jgi:glycine reductase
MVPRVLHYLNQYFGGIGGEQQAGAPPRFVPEAVGPARLLKQLLGAEATMIGTLICGDNYFHEERASALEAVAAILDAQKPDLVIAGPAFNAGRYGLACDAVCHLALERQIPAVTGMHPGNPALATSGGGVYVVPTAARASAMADALGRMAALGLKLARGEALGPAAQEGYLSRGIRLNVVGDRSAAERVVEMLWARLRGQEVASEIPLVAGERVSPALPISDLREAVIAVVTEAGIVPKGNPFGLSHVHARQWAKYSVAGLGELRAGEFEGIHGGFDTRFANEDPNRIVPLDVLRELERGGRIKALHEMVYVTVGNGTPVPYCARFGQEIAAELKAAGVSGVLVPST